MKPIENMDLYCERARRMKVFLREMPEPDKGLQYVVARSAALLLSSLCNGKWRAMWWLLKHELSGWWWSIRNLPSIVKMRWRMHGMNEKQRIQYINQTLDQEAEQI